MSMNKKNRIITCIIIKNFDVWVVMRTSNHTSLGFQWLKWRQVGLI